VDELKKSKKVGEKSSFDWLNVPGAREELYADLHRDYWKEWKRALKTYLDNPLDAHNAVRFLELHPANQRLAWGSPEPFFHENLTWFFVTVDPTTKRIETRKNPGWKKNKRGKYPPDKKRNTETNVWVEWGPYTEGPSELVPGSRGISTHDPRVDTGGRTFEKAMVNLAHNIWALYGGNANVADVARLKEKNRW